jgi:hypothetical protein
MVAADHNLSQLAGADTDLVGTGAVADNIPEVHQQVEGRSVRQAGFQGFKVGVDIAQEKYAHESPDKLPIIDRAEMIATPAEFLFASMGSEIGIFNHTS